MTFTNIFDKLKIVLDLITSSNIFIVFIILIVATFILRLTNAINNKKLGILVNLIELITFGIIFYIERSKMINLTNELIDNIFLNFYFPSIYVYLFIFVFSIVIFIYTLLNKRISKTYRNITNIYFYTLNFIFILLTDVVVKNNIDIFEKTSLFTNNNALVLLELSTLIFFLYLVINTLIYITNYIILLVENRNTSVVKNKKVVNLGVEINIEKEKDNNELTNKPLISFNELVNKLDTVSQSQTKVNNIKLPKEISKPVIDLVPEVKTGFKFIDPTLFEETTIIENNILLNETQNLTNVNIIKDTPKENITLKDYKLFSQMLKTIIISKNSTNLTMSDLLNNKLSYLYTEEECNKFKKILNSCLN